MNPNYNNMQTYERAVSLYMENCIAGEKSKDTMSIYSDSLKFYAQFCGTEKDPLAPSTLIEWKSEMRFKQNATSTIALRLSHIKQFFDFAVSMKLIAESPCNAHVMNVGKVEKQPYEHLISESEIRLIFRSDRPDGMWRKTWTRNKAILITFLCSGIRNSELRSLKLSDVDFENGHVLVEHGKGNKRGIAPLGEVAQSAIKEYLASGYRPNELSNNDLLFGSIEKRFGGSWSMLDRSGLSALTERTIDALTGRDGIRTHALRHACASLMLDSGLPIEVISESLRHADIGITKRTYAQYMNANKPMSMANAVFDGI
jgi:site-specific recombinase XerD